MLRHLEAETSVAVIEVSHSLTINQRLTRHLSPNDVARMRSSCVFAPLQSEEWWRKAKDIALMDIGLNPGMASFLIGHVIASETLIPSQ
jgi:hypothetical protein